MAADVVRGEEKTGVEDGDGGSSMIPDRSPFLRITFRWIWGADRTRTAQPFNARLALIAVGAGLSLALSFPRPGIDLFAWFAWAPILLIAGRLRLPHSFLLGWLAGFSMFAVSLRWLTETMINYGGMTPLVAYFTVGILAVYLAIYPGFAIAGAEYLRRRLRLPWMLGFPILWVATEYLRSIMLTGFPWNLLGHALWRRLGLIQIVSVFGVAAVSALIAVHNGAIAAWIKAPDRRRTIALTGCWLLIGALSWHGGNLIPTEPLSEPPAFRASLIQANIPQAEKWRSDKREEHLELFLSMTEEAFAEGADLVVWPEAATEFYYSLGHRYSYRGEMSMREAIEGVMRERNGYLLFGSPDIGRMGEHYNSSCLLGRDGRLLAQYHKRHLVPFGEYVPLRKLLFFAKKLVVLPGDFAAGTDAVIMDVAGVPSGVYICYETAFADLLRQFRRNGAQLLINLTNDAWFGLSDGPYQHFAMTVFRAIENRAPVIRCANSGISGMIDHWGRIRTRSQLGERDRIDVDVRPNGGASLYARMGEAFAQIHLALAAILLVAARLIPRRSA